MLLEFKKKNLTTVHYNHSKGNFNSQHAPSVDIETTHTGLLNHTESWSIIFLESF